MSTPTIDPQAVDGFFEDVKRTFIHHVTTAPDAQEIPLEGSIAASATDDGVVWQVRGKAVLVSTRPLTPEEFQQRRQQFEALVEATQPEIRRYFFDRGADDHRHEAKGAHERLRRAITEAVLDFERVTGLHVRSVAAEMPADPCGERRPGQEARAYPSSLMSTTITLGQ